jgi:type II secretory pathway pseudopilin PulG
MNTGYADFFTFCQLQTSYNIYPLIHPKILLKQTNKFGTIYSVNIVMKLHKIAFTLIELFVIILIIGILAVITLPQHQKAVYKARLSQAFVPVKAIKNSQEGYYLANGRYTTDMNGLDVSVTDCSLSSGNSGL